LGSGIDYGTALVNASNAVGGGGGYGAWVELHYPLGKNTL
jgi:hypothetical protein